ncbi:acyltransferase family protein [Mesorhizobium sp. L-8-3]|uniref:acyltransferase family protein n=1 Tax=Mesorhizobium sp. L-8-3 TaxID=2744522 RepID=UPI0019271297|nr:acyltransferase [Mesorhizobium sp. L-8-3]BCH23902.1 acyltransferase [Mesorhizobium sp. L-8-3]
MPRLYGIQYLRAVAALAVVVYHATDRTGSRFTVGAAGVDIFFVISGFVMWTLAETRPTTPLRFYRDRTLRIAPLYWLVTMVMVAGALAGLFPRVRLTLDHVLASLLFIPHRSPSNGELWPLLVQGWTLNLEMFFYLIFGLVLLLPRSRRFTALAGALLILVAAGLVLVPSDPVLFTYTRPIMLEFLCGAALGRLWLTRRLPGRFFGGAAVLAASAGFAWLAVYPGMIHEFLFGLFAVLLVTGVLTLEKGGAVRRFPLLNYLGDSSYSIYLWHALAVSVVFKLAAMLAFSQFATAAAATLAGTLLGVLSYEILEKPLMALTKGRRPASSAARPASAEAAS